MKDRIWLIFDLSISCRATASKSLRPCTAKPCIIHLLSTATFQRRGKNLIFKWRCAVERAYVPTDKKRLLVSGTCVLNYGCLISPSTFCLPVVGSLHRVSIWRLTAATTLEEGVGKGVKPSSISGNRWLYWKSMPLPCIYHCHSCSAYFWYSPCIVSSDCHVIKSLLITRAYFYAEISIRSLLQRPPDQ